MIGVKAKYKNGKIEFTDAPPFNVKECEVIVIFEEDDFDLLKETQMWDELSDEAMINFEKFLNESK